MEKEENSTSKKTQVRSPLIQLTTLRRFGILIVTFIIAYLPQNILPIGTAWRSLIILGLLVIWTFFEIGSLRLNKARKLIQRGKTEEGWKQFEKVAKNSIVPLSSDEKLFLGTVFIQHSNEPEVGIEYLEKWILKTKNEFNKIRATNSLALGYFRIGDKAKAIELSKDLYDKGYDDVGLLVNYSSFLLANGDYEKAFDIIEKGGNNIYILDNLGAYYLVNNMHKDAINLYREILDNMQPRFVEFYIHAFQSEIYYNCKENARNMLNSALSCPRVMTSPFTKEYIERLKKDMENSQGCIKINAGVEEVAFGREWTNTSKTFTPPSNEDIEYFNRDPYENLKDEEEVEEETENKEENKEVKTEVKGDFKDENGNVNK